MNIRLFALFAFIGILGSFAEARMGFFPHFGNGVRIDRQLTTQARLKREVDDSNGETANSNETTKSTTSQATEKTSSSTSDSSTEPEIGSTEYPSSSITPSSTQATSPTSTSISTITPKPITPPPESMRTSEQPAIKPRVDVASNEHPKNPNPTSMISRPPNANVSPYGPFNFPGMYMDPYFGSPLGYNPYPTYPGVNSIPGSGSNYAWTSTGGMPGYSSSSAFAGSSAGSFPSPNYQETPYTREGFPGAGSPNIGSRGGFQDNSPGRTEPGHYGPTRDPFFNTAPGFNNLHFPMFNNPSIEELQQQIRQLQAEIERQQADMEYQNRFMNEGGYYGNGVPQSAISSVAIGPHGGYQRGEINPVGPGIESRFAEDLPPPSGNSYAVFASSSSSSKTGPDGKQINHKTSTTGVNDNGKISFRTVHD